MKTKPQTTAHPSDRRRCRSRFRYEAAGIYLRRLRHRAGLRAVTLSDENGLVVVGAGRPRDLEYLALWGAESASDQGIWRQEVDAFAPNQPFFSLRIDLGPTELRLSGVGSAVLCRDEVEGALRRILA